MTDVIVVESPAKAKTINKYVGSGYTVLASFGHVRDLSPKDGSVRPDENFAMAWETDDRGNKHISEIARALKRAKSLYLATDPDREGEAISWHVRAVLEEKKLLQNVTVQRVTFNEITKGAILKAMANPRGLDQPLIDAYLARRALDYLVGFTLSPVLWRKLPGSRSAGRVQSVALRLVCEREAEIEVFRSQEYWSVSAHVANKDAAPFTARLFSLDGKKLERFDLKDEETAERARKKVVATALKVQSVERKKLKRHPSAPFTTSTLQQEASRKLGMSAQTTMRTAQQLYEGVELQGEVSGLITYMRTDGVQMAAEAITALRHHITDAYGNDYCPAQPRHYSSKAKNAQEAHEAIRPTDISRTPNSLEGYLNSDQLRLYTLIYKRAVASQMQSAALDQVIVSLEDNAKTVGLRASGSTITFDGFLRVYSEGLDDQRAEDGEGGLLPPVAEGEAISTQQVLAEQHFTQPPPRYSEASLVKKMEEIGIGRPSTYASILSVLRDREYVRLENKRFIPEDRGRLVTAFLTSFFERYVDTDFTAQLEGKLDDISGGRADWHDIMAEFWRDFSSAVAQTKDLKISDVIDALDRDLGPHFFPTPEDGSDPRACSACHTGRLGLRLGKFGAFIGCSNYPECQYTRPLIADDSTDATAARGGMRVVGVDTATGDEISLRRGPYGAYLQRGDIDPEQKQNKPKRITLPNGVDGQNMSLEEALSYLSLPRKLGVHPETGEPIEAGLGRFGPFVHMGSLYGPLTRDDHVLTLGLERAVEILDKKRASIRTLGLHPEDDAPILVRKGRFGPYVQHGKVIANLPKGTDMAQITLEEAIDALKLRGKASSKKTARSAKETTKGARAAPKKKSSRGTAVKAKKDTPKR